MAHSRNMCLSLGQEMYAPDYICLMEDDHGYKDGYIKGMVNAMKQYYGKTSPLNMKHGLFSGCKACNRQAALKLEGTNHFIPGPNFPAPEQGRLNSCCRCAPTAHWNNVLKGYDTDEYLISTYQTRRLNERNYHKGFNSMVVEGGDLMFTVPDLGRGASDNSHPRLWDDTHCASDKRSVFRGKK